MIDIRNVTRTYGAKVAVDNLSLHIPSGQIFAFLGPNGAGKTTTIKMMVGLLIPNQGSLCLGGHNIVTESRQAKLLVGYVPDQPQIYDKLTGREFLDFVGEMYGMTVEQRVEAIRQQMEIFELETFADQLTQSYSHGMKQRVAFASAMIHAPRVVILDEPMVGLDPKNMRVVKNLLRSLANQGTTVFMSTHTLSVAEEIADRIGIINNGQLQFIGDLEELRLQVSKTSGCQSLEDSYLELTLS